MGTDGESGAKSERAGGNGDLNGLTIQALSPCSHFCCFLKQSCCGCCKKAQCHVDSTTFIIPQARTSYNYVRERNPKQDGYLTVGTGYLRQDDIFGNGSGR